MDFGPLFISLQGNKGLLCNSNTNSNIILKCIVCFITQNLEFIHLQAAAVNWPQAWSLLLSVWRRVQHCVLNYCRTLTQWKVIVECYAAGGPLQPMLSEVEKQWSTEMKWSYCHLRAQINPGQSNEHYWNRLTKRWWDTLPWLISKAPANKQKDSFEGGHDKKWVDTHLHVFKNWRASWPWPWWTVCQLASAW